MEAFTTLDIVKEFNCALCGKLFDDSNSLNDHVESEHSGSQHVVLVSDGGNGEEVKIDIDMTAVSECSEAVNNLIYLSTHTTQQTNGPSGPKAINTSNSCRSNNVKTAKVIKTSLFDRARGEKLYRCSECLYSSDSTSNIYKHMKNAHKEFVIEKMNKNARPSCSSNAQYNNIVSIVKTSQEERDRGEKMYRCSECGYTDDSTSNLYKHMKIKHKYCPIKKVVSYERSPPHPVPDEYCSSGDKTVKVVKTPQEGIDKGERVYQCSECGKSSSTTGNLYRHMEVAHPGHSIQKIKHFDSSIPRRRPLEVNAIKSPEFNRIVKIIKTPIEEIAKGSKPYKCSECGKGSDNTSNLYGHMELSHSDCIIQPIKQPVGGILFEQLVTDPTGDNTVQPLEFMSNGKLMYKCSRCYLATATPSNLYKHMRRKHKGFTILRKAPATRKKPKKTPKRKKSARRELITGDISDFENDLTNFYDGSDDEGMVKPDSGFSFAGTFEAYECSVCMETFSSCNELDLHVQIHEEEVDENVLPDQNVDMGMPDIKNVGGDDEGEDDNDEDLHNELIEDSSGNQSEIMTKYEVVVKSLEPIHNVSREDMDTSVMSDGSNRMESQQDVNASNTYPITRMTTRSKAAASPKMASTTSSRSEMKTVRIIKASAEEKKRGKKMYQCSECDKSSNFTSNLYKHMASEHKDFTVEKITGLAKRSSSSDDALAAAKRMVKSQGRQSSSLDRTVKVIKTSAQKRKEGEKMYQCSECGHSSDFTSNLYKHMKTEHKGLIIEKITDSASHSISSVVDNVVRIVKTPGKEKNAGEKLYQCSECGHSSDFTSNLYKHMKTEHKGFIIEKIKDVGLGSQHQEDISVNEVSSSSLFDKTIRVIKSSAEERGRGHKLYRCSDCSYSSNSTSNVYKHMRTNHRDCVIEKLKDLNRICSLDSKSVQVVNIASSGRALYQCSKCDLTSNNTSNLYKHMRRMHTEFVIVKRDKSREETLDSFASFSDDDCDASMNNTGLFSSGDPSLTFECYECSICMETFSACDDLDTHVKIQHG